MANPKGNPQNLKPVRTKEEAKKRGAAGGKKSGAARRKKRDARQAIRYVLDMAATGKLDEKLEGLGFDEEDRTNMKQDPGYLANLKALALVEQERLLHGNWKIKPAAGLFFKRTQVGEMLQNVPLDVVKWVRAWDLAATSEDEGGNPAYTAGVLMGKRSNGRYVIANVVNVRLSASEVRQTVKMNAAMDIARYKRVRVRLPQDPGQAGKDQAQSYIKFMAGYDVCAIAESGSKEARAEPVAAQWQAGNFDVVIGDWNEEYFAQLESFPASRYKDMVDATSSAFAEIENVFDIGGLIT